MIDATLGRITFDDGGHVEPSTTRAEFLASPLARDSTASTMPASAYASFTLAPRAMDGRAFLFGVTLRFDGEALATVDLWQIDPDDPPSWDAWSMDKEIAKQTRNEAWLASCLGPPHESYPLSELEPDRYPRGTRYRFAWGTIASFFSPQTGGTALVVAYDGPRVIGGGPGAPDASSRGA